MKANSLQVQNRSQPSYQKTCKETSYMQCMAYEQRWKEAILSKAVESGFKLATKVNVAKQVRIFRLTMQFCLNVQW